MSEKRVSKRTASKKAATVTSEEDSTANTKRTSKRQQTSKKEHKVGDQNEDTKQQVRDLEEENEHDVNDKREDSEDKVNETEDSDAKDNNSNRKRAGKTQKKSDSEPPSKVTKQEGKLNKTDSDFSLLDFSSKSETKDGKAWNFKISSWNVSGLRALIKKNGFDFLKYEDPDVFVMQETKCSTGKLPPEAIIDGYHKYWSAADKEGYSGTSLFSKVKPLNVTYGMGIKEHDTEGRIITAEYDKFYLVNTYVPNAGRGLVTLPKRMKWDEDLRAYLKKLDAKKPVILCGDLNVAHNEIDLANPKTNTKNAGFTKEEREGMTALLEEGFVDSFRHLYPDKSGAYTFWAYFGNARAKNVGWRLDYFILSERLLKNLCDNIIRSDVYGSDHCPITLLLNI